MKEKLWSSIVRINHANKLSTRNLIEDITQKISENFVTEVIIQNTNELSKHAATALWRPLESNEIKTHEEHNLVDCQSYNNLMETLSSLLKEDTLYVLFLHYFTIISVNIQNMGTAKNSNIVIMSSSSKACANSIIMYSNVC
jgi:hypothetical protein